MAARREHRKSTSAKEPRCIYSTFYAYNYKAFRLFSKAHKGLVPGAWLIIVRWRKRFSWIFIGLVRTSVLIFRKLSKLKYTISTFLFQISQIKKHSSPTYFVGASHFFKYYKRMNIELRHRVNLPYIASAEATADDCSQDTWHFSAC